MKVFLGVDVGSVSTNLVLINNQCSAIQWIYRRTQGRPIEAVQQGLVDLESLIEEPVEITGVGTTGSARFLSGVVVGADIVKNEITAHAVAAQQLVPGVRTVLEIGGQDSKIIILRDGIVVDFAMNTVCAAGTGSFLDHQAERLDLPIEEFGRVASKSNSPAHIAGRCTVFAESDMIHKQQVGCSIEDITAGLCEALVRNYLNNLAKGRKLQEPIVFQGGVAANIGIKKAFEKAISSEVVVPRYHHVMGAIGAAILAKEKMDRQAYKSKFRGFEASGQEFRTSSFQCAGCTNTCEVVKIKTGRKLLACWGGRCGKWEEAALKDRI